MKNVNFTIGRTRNASFTQGQTTKIEAGLAILKQVMASAAFKNKVINYNWKGEQEVYYDRFHLSNGLSNVQILRCIEDCAAQFKLLGTPQPVLAILPCSSRKEMQGYTNLSATTIWLHNSWLNNDWYTPVHVAACIAHEICVKLGFRAHAHGQLVSDYDYTVPYACGELIKEIAMDWSNEMNTVKNSMDYLLDMNFEYYPCSTVFDMGDWNGEVVTAYQKAGSLVNRLAMEIDHLKSIREPLGTSEFNRLEALEKCTNMLKDMQSMLVETSLDASDNIGAVRAVAEAAYV